jgi:periplasmic copper chaperone A
LKTRLFVVAATCAAAHVRQLLLSLLLGASGAALAATDAQQIAQAMKAEFDSPGAPLSAEPVSVEGSFAIAGWSQSGSGGRALLQKLGNQWQIVLCAGDGLLQPAMLVNAGMSRETADRLVAATRAAESRLPSSRRELFSRFNGVVKIGKASDHKGSPHAEHSVHATHAGSPATGTLTVTGAWARATPPGLTVGGAYFTLVNHGTQPDTLVSISTPVAATAALHRTALENGLSTMRAAGQITIAPGATLKAEPGGLHVMLMGLKSPLVAGSKVPLTLTFRLAGAITVQVAVQPLNPGSPTGNAGH